MWDFCMSWLGHNALWRDLAGALVFCSDNTWPLSARGKQLISLVYYSVFHHVLCIVFFFFFCSRISDQIRPPRTRDIAGILWNQINILPFLFLLKLLEILRTYDPAVEIWLYHRAGCSTIIYKRPVAARSEWTKRREPATWNSWTVIIGNIPAQFKKPEVWDFSLNSPCLLTRDLSLWWNR